MNSFSRQDVLRILQISSRQLLGWEKAGLIAQRETYTFQDLGQLRTLRSLREDDVSSASIRHSVAAMQAVAGMSNPLAGGVAGAHGDAAGVPLRRGDGGSDPATTAF